LVTDLSQKPASDFVASKSNAVRGFGFSLNAPFYDPTVAADGFNNVGPLYAALMPASDGDDDEAVLSISAVLLRNVVDCWDMAKVSETKGFRTVQKLHLDGLKSAFPFLRTSTEVKQSMASLQCKEGVTTEGSEMDSWFVDEDGMVRGNYEVKGTDHAPGEALRQSAAYGSHIVFHQLRKGVAWKDIIIPLVAGTGSLVQFAAVCVLAPSFPYVIVLSKVLDINDAADRSIAARHWHAILQLVATKTIRTETTPLPQMSASFGLSTSEYHVKKLGDVFLVTDDIHSSLSRIFRSMAVASRSLKCRQTMVFPLCVREGTRSEGDMLVFPLMSDYRIGMPESETDQIALVTAVRAAMGAFHDVGLVHMDFYPSNIMWKKSAGAMLVKIVDWDAVHIIDEPLSRNVRERLTVARKSLCEAAGGSTTTACIQWDTSLLDLIAKRHGEKSLQTDDKAMLDRAFRVLQQ
jgi:hypothetical protein